MRRYYDDGGQRMKLEHLAHPARGADYGSRARGQQAAPTAFAAWVATVSTACGWGRQLEGEVQQIAAQIRQLAGDVRQLARTWAAYGALLLCDIAVACTPAYRPSTRSTITPYLGHSFTFLRTLLDVRLAGFL